MVRSGIRSSISSRPALLPLLVLLLGRADSFDPYVNQAPLGAATGCAMHGLAHEFAQVVLPPHLRATGSLRARQIWDSLFSGDMEEGNFGGGKMGTCNRTAPAGAARPTPPTPPPAASGAPAWFVDMSSGSDSAGGTATAPFQHVARALAASRASTAPGRRIVLRSGIHFLSEALSLGPQDSGLVIENYPAEEAWLSGAAPLPPSLEWKPFTPPASGGAPGNMSGIWQAVVPDSINVSAGFFGLHVLQDDDPWHTMMTRARYPNRDPDAGVRDTKWTAIGKNATWEEMPWPGYGHQHVANATREIPKNLTVFPDYFVYGVGGLCGADYVGFDPPGGYVCSIHGGMHGGDIDERTGNWSCPGCTDGYPKAFPKALLLTNTTGATQTAFPHADTWADDVSEAVLETWVNGWFTTFWQLKGYDASVGRLSLGKGGFHGGQPHMLDGIQKDGSIGGPDEFLPEANVTNPLDAASMNQVMIQNLLAELDAEEEWYFDSKTRTLYFFPNSTTTTTAADTSGYADASPPATLPLGIVRLQNLLRVVGGGASPTAVPGSSPGWHPVKDVTIRGIGFRDAGFSYLAPHGVPSGGDWGMQSPQYPDTAGAIYLSGTEGVSIVNCTLKYLAGNAVYLAGFNRDASVVGSELTQIGDSPIALWGWTKSDDPQMPAGTGMDGSDGNQPRRTTITGNLCHEYGFNQKQSSCVFMAKSMQTNVTSNVMFNAARAHINQNDGFGGGTNIEGNLIYSSCRESSDHGVFRETHRHTQTHPDLALSYLTYLCVQPQHSLHAHPRTPYAYRTARFRGLLMSWVIFFINAGQALPPQP